MILEMDSKYLRLPWWPHTNGHTTLRVLRGRLPATFAIPRSSIALWDSAMTAPTNTSRAC